MNKTCLTLSLLLLTGCAYKPFPEVSLLAVDLVSGICAEYQILDREKLTVKLLAETPLEAGGPCDGAIGFKHAEYNLKVKPWIREAVAKLKEKPR